MCAKITVDPFYDHYASRTSQMLSSEVRDLLAVTARPDIISFAGGLPYTEAIDPEVMLETVSGVLKEDCPAALQYGPTDGYVPLKHDLVEVMAEEGIPSLPEDIVITHGAQQGLDLLAKILINPGDHIIMEGPTYVGALNSFVSYQPVIHTVPLDDGGLVVERLEETLEGLASRGIRPKFLYTVSNFQNPTGITLEEERRHALLSLSREYDFIILEDNPYGLLRYEGEPIPALRSLDAERVVYLGTLSKIFSAGMRIGWVTAPRPVLEKVLLAKQSADLCTSSFTQRVAHRFFHERDWRGLIRKLRTIYRERRDAMLSALEEFFPEEITWTKPGGGLFVWVTLPDYINSSDMLASALEYKVAFVPGTGFFPPPGGNNFIRLNFSYPELDEIWEGIKRLSKVVKRELSLASCLGLDVGAVSKGSCERGSI
jgi:2-aminoadipate transaminase